MLFSVSLKGWHICRRCETHQRRSGAWGQGVEMLIQILGTVTIQKHPRSLGPTLNASSLNKKNHRRGLSNKITLSFFFCITTVWPCDFSRTTHTRQKTRRSQKWHWKALVFWRKSTIFKTRTFISSPHVVFCFPERLAHLQTMRNPPAKIRRMGSGCRDVDPDPWHCHLSGVPC